MSYKKIVSLLAVSTLALAACGTADDAEEPTTDDTEQVDDAENTETEETDAGTSVQDQIEQAKEASGDAFPEYGLYVAGQWTEDGVVVGYAPGEAAELPVQITTEAETYFVYLLENGVITQVVTDDPEPALVVAEPSADTEYLVGISPDDLGAEGDELTEDDFYRADRVLLEEQEPAAEEE